MECATCPAVAAGFAAELPVAVATPFTTPDGERAPGILKEKPISGDAEHPETVEFFRHGVAGFRIEDGPRVAAKVPAAVAAPRFGLAFVDEHARGHSPIPPAALSSKSEPCWT